MEHLRLKLKLGDLEFEAEGPPPAVQAQFLAFKELVRPPAAEPCAIDEPTEQEIRESPVALALLPVDVTALMRLEGRIVSLATAPASVDEGILLTLLGQKLLRNNEQVMGGEIIEGIRRSGRYVHRVDYRTQKLVHAGDVVAIGHRRATRYRLTKRGLARAEALVRSASTTV